jgi:hypothetical protein
VQARTSLSTVGGDDELATIRAVLLEVHGAVNREEVVGDTLHQMSENRPRDERTHGSVTRRSQVGR